MALPHLFFVEKTVKTKFEYKKNNRQSKQQNARMLTTRLSQNFAQQNMTKMETKENNENNENDRCFKRTKDNCV